ncbi:MAG: PEP-CTERM sorting domain-containing protein [Phenylobacterium sp.]|uniref:PEPxxWA-CTERM sorting domain-containing protein n=1 Tax=Phenylobacterium sp. TaxID=1871053 RepID=UPI001A190877|nr:PEPxxWA-CTERM sorting domain-containing protein [Phenylobacterium sp.]MBJ7408884.1 PEP-CTERM sorting domain-containing protein [Phenylobacterium sp.]
MLRTLLIAVAVAMVGSSANALTVLDNRDGYQYQTEIFWDFPATQSFKFRYDFDPATSSPTNRFEVDYRYNVHNPEVEYDEFGEIIYHHDWVYVNGGNCFLTEGNTCTRDNMTATFTPGRLEVVITGRPAGTFTGPCIGTFVTQCYDGLYVEAIWDTFPVWNEKPNEYGIIPYRLTYGDADDPAWNREPAAVPEPSTWALMIMGFGATGAMLRRRYSFA